MTGRLGAPRAHFRLTDSTNLRARELATSGAPHGTLVTATEQSAGRGRMGRRWAGPPGQALLFSVVLRHFDGLLPLRAGLAVADVAGAAARVKWPNDVLVSGRKVAGILAEARPLDGWAVIGIGLNVAVDLDDLPEELRGTAGTLGRSVADLEPTLSEVLAALEARLGEPAAATVGALRARDALLDVDLRWTDGADERVGTGAGIDGEGRLLVRDDHGVCRTLEAGEVHLGPPRAAF